MRCATAVPRKLKILCNVCNYHACVFFRGGSGCGQSLTFHLLSGWLPLNKWNVSNVEDMLSMFQNCEDFNQPLNNWNVSNVEDMENMFQNARSFNQPLHAPWYHEESDSE